MNLTPNSFSDGGKYIKKRKGEQHAKKLIKASALAGADAIKFQTLLPGQSEKLINKKDLKISFRTARGKKTENMLKILEKRELPKKMWKELVDYSHKQGLAFISLKFFLYILLL